MWRTVIFLLFFFGCKPEKSSVSKENMGVFAIRASKVTIEGSAIKGLVKNAVVNITPLNSDGTCSSTIITSGTTDSTGFYSLAYPRTGSNVCLIIKKNPNGKSAVFDEKTSQDVVLGTDSKFEMQTVIQESKIKGNRKDTLVSPFSRMLFSRLKVLAKQAGSSADLSKLIPQASKEIVIRFGLNKGFSASKTADSATSARSVSDKDYPELDDIIIELQNPTSPVTMKFLSILTGFSYLASKHKKGTALSIEDIDSIIDALAEDFSDGIFDGVNSSGTAVTIGPSKTPLGNNSLTGIFLPAVQSYFREGGTLYFGQNSEAPNVSVTSYLSEIVFADTVTVVSEFSASAPTAPSISFTTSVYAPTENAAMTAITPVVSGTVTSCTSSPALPTGMTLNSTTCAITGTPTARKTSAQYTITASGSAGSASAAITLAVIPSAFLKIFSTAGSLGPNLVGANADSTCMADGNKPGGGGTYKAMAALTTRRACTTANCSGGASENFNWILYPNTQYRRGDGVTVIGTTTASAIFTFNLTNSFTSSAVFPSTFLNTDWTQNATENCSDGTSTAGNVRFAQGVSTTNGSISFNSTGCNAGGRELYCVEQ